MTPRFPKCLALAALTLCVASALPAQTDASNIESITMTVGRSLPLDLPSAVTQVTVANPAVADVVVLNERTVVLNAKEIGETDVLLTGPTLARRHLRIAVYQATDRRQIALAVKFAEVRRDALTELGINGRFDATSGNLSTGTGVLAPNAAGQTAPIVSAGNRFLGVLSNFGTDDITGFLDAQEQLGNARSLAEPTLIAGNREEASFLAGGEIPVPVAQPGQGGQVFIVIQYRPFGVQLKFNGTVISDTLLQLRVEPEVSSLDFGNAVLLAGFRIPAIRTRRVATTLDVRPGQSLIISGLFNEERESVRTGIPGLMRLPILGALFSSNRWQSAESELLVVVTPVLLDANTMRPTDRIELVPDSTLPARDAIRKRLPPDGR